MGFFSCSWNCLYIYVNWKPPYYVVVAIVEFLTRVTDLCGFFILNILSCSISLFMFNITSKSLSTYTTWNVWIFQLYWSSHRDVLSAKIVGDIDMPTVLKGEKYIYKSVSFCRAWKSRALVWPNLIMQIWFCNCSFKTIWSCCRNIARRGFTNYCFWYKSIFWDHLGRTD